VVGDRPACSSGFRDATGDLCTSRLPKVDPITKLEGIEDIVLRVVVGLVAVDVY